MIVVWSTSLYPTRMFREWLGIERRCQAFWYSMNAVNGLWRKDVGTCRPVSFLAQIKVLSISRLILQGCSWCSYLVSMYHGDLFNLLIVAPSSACRSVILVFDSLFRLFFSWFVSYVRSCTSPFSCCMICSDPLFVLLRSSLVQVEVVLISSLVFPFDSWLIIPNIQRKVQVAARSPSILRPKLPAQLRLMNTECKEMSLDLCWVRHDSLSHSQVPGFWCKLKRLPTIKICAMVLQCDFRMHHENQYCPDDIISQYREWVRNASKAYSYDPLRYWWPLKTARIISMHALQLPVI